MEFIVGVLLLLTFFALAYYCIKGYNLMIGFLVITVIWTVLSLGGPRVCVRFLPGELSDPVESVDPEPERDLSVRS